jgi:hypothetical protein
MTCLSLKYFLQNHIADIQARLYFHLSRPPRTSYKDFLINFDKGKRHIKKWIESVSKALDGTRQKFLQNQRQIGRLRSVQEYTFKDISEVYESINKAVKDVLSMTLLSQEVLPAGLVRELQDFSQLIFFGYGILLDSLLSTSEETKNKKERVVHEFYGFSQDIIALIDMESIVSLFLDKLKTLFDVNQTCLTLYQTQQIYRSFGNSKLWKRKSGRSVVEKS